MVGSWADSFCSQGRISFLVQRLAVNDPRRLAVVDGHLAAGVDAAAEELAVFSPLFHRHANAAPDVLLRPLSIPHYTWSITLST